MLNRSLLMSIAVETMTIQPCIGIDNGWYRHVTPERVTTREVLV